MPSNKEGARRITCEHLMLDRDAEIWQAAIRAVDKYLHANPELCPICVCISLAGAIGIAARNNTMPEDRKFYLLQTMFSMMVDGFNFEATEFEYKLKSLDFVQVKVSKA